MVVKRGLDVPEKTEVSQLSLRFPTQARAGANCILSEYKLNLSNIPRRPLADCLDGFSSEQRSRRAATTRG